MSDDGDRAPSDVVSPDGSGGTGGSGASDDRTPLMSIPEIQQLSGALIENGYGDVVDKTEAYLEIDTTAMKFAALAKYGVSAQEGHPVAPPKGTDPFEVSVFEPNTFLFRNSANTLDLEDFALEVKDKMLSQLSNRWEGDAFEAFSDYISELRAVIGKEADRHRTIGSALYEVAEAIEKAQDESEMTFWGAAGIALTGTGVVTAAVTGTGVLAALAGGLTTAASYGEEYAGRAKEVLGQESDSALNIRHPEYMETRPSEALAEHPYPKDPKEWEVGSG